MGMGLQKCILIIKSDYDSIMGTTNKPASGLTDAGLFPS